MKWLEFPVATWKFGQLSLLQIPLFSHDFVSFYPSFKSSFPKRVLPRGLRDVGRFPSPSPCTGTPLQARLPVPKLISWQVQGVWLLEKSTSMFNSPQLTFLLPNCLSTFWTQAYTYQLLYQAARGKKDDFSENCDHYVVPGSGCQEHHQHFQSPTDIGMSRPWCLQSTTILNMPQRKLSIRSWEHSANKKGQICRNPFFHSIFLSAILNITFTTHKVLNIFLV